MDRSGKHDLADLRSLQDWFLKYELKTIPDVAEVASVGGVVKEYQVVIDPQRLAQYGISLAEVKSALDASNQKRAVRRSNWRKRNIWCAPAAICKRSTTLITSF